MKLTCQNLFNHLKIHLTMTEEQEKMQKYLEDLMVNAEAEAKKYRRQLLFWAVGLAIILISIGIIIGKFIL